VLTMSPRANQPAKARDIQQGENARRHPPIDLIENGNMPGTRQGFDLTSKILGDPRQLREVLTGGVIAAMLRGNSATLRAAFR
jgi:hypothetical protein